MAELVASFLGSIIGAAVDFALGTVLPGWLVGAAATRRVHDFGWPFYALAILFLGLGGVELGAFRYFQDRGVLFGIVAWFVFILVWAIPPGTPGENRYDPQPNPGPSL